MSRILATHRCARHGGGSGGSHLLGWDGNFGATTRVAKAGDKITIYFENYVLRGKTVTITIDNGKGDKRKQDIKLDKNGLGSASFVIPAGWVVAKLNHSSSQEHAILVTP